MKPLGKKPALVFIGPDRYAATVFLITGHDKLGRPRELRILYDDEVMKIEGGEHFLIAYVQPKLLKATQN